MEAKNEVTPPLHGEIIFIGTGTSEGIPRVSCLTEGFEEDEVEPKNRCKVCFDAVRTDIRSPNRRRNTSLLIRCPRNPGATKESSNGDDQPAAGRTHVNVLIDCGKFFWASAMEWFPQHRIRFIDALVLTHRHNDACYGIDDLRDWTRMKGADLLDVYLRKEDLEYMSGPFPYLVDTSTVPPQSYIPLVTLF